MNYPTDTLPRRRVPCGCGGGWVNVGDRVHVRGITFPVYVAAIVRDRHLEQRGEPNPVAVRISLTKRDDRRSRLYPINHVSCKPFD